MAVGKFALNRILEENVPAAFTACFAPRCSNFGVPVTQTEIDRSNSEASQQEALLQMEIAVKKHLSAVVRDNISIMTEGDEALLMELEVAFEASNESQDSISDFTDLNTIGEETLDDIENRRGDNNVPVAAPRLPNLPGAYKNSVKSKFDYYRQHVSFSASALRPIEESSDSDDQGKGSSPSSTSDVHPDVVVEPTSEECTTTEPLDSAQSVPSPSSTPSAATSSPPPCGDDVVALVEESDKQSTTISPDEADQGTDSTSPTIPTDEELKPLSVTVEHNELAKQILQRRQSVPMTPGRVAVDP